MSRQERRTPSNPGGWSRAVKSRHRCRRCRCRRRFRYCADESSHAYWVHPGNGNQDVTQARPWKPLPLSVWAGREVEERRSCEPQRGGGSSVGGRIQARMGRDGRYREGWPSIGSHRLRITWIRVWLISVGWDGMSKDEWLDKMNCEMGWDGMTRMTMAIQDLLLIFSGLNSRSQEGCDYDSLLISGPHDLWNNYWFPTLRFQDPNWVGVLII